MLFRRLPCPKPCALMSWQNNVLACCSRAGARRICLSCFMRGRPGVGRPVIGCCSSGLAPHGCCVKWMRWKPSPNWLRMALAAPSSAGMGWIATTPHCRAVHPFGWGHPAGWAAVLAARQPPPGAAGVAAGLGDPWLTQPVSGGDARGRFALDQRRPAAPASTSHHS